MHRPKIDATLDLMTPQELAAPFDTVSICLSKGLGAPVGSVLLGPTEFIHQARRWRKMVGGGMRQAGIIAAAGLYALENNITRLEQDHQHATQLAQTLRNKFGEEIIACATNMIHLSLPNDIYQPLQKHLGDLGIRVGRPRWVIHLDINETAVEQIEEAVVAF